MTLKAVDKTNWAGVLSTALGDYQVVRVISPFVSDNAAAFLLRNFTGNSIQIITRYNLEDFFAGVSQLNALSRLLKAGARVRGIRALHSKVYIFDRTSTIITSANLTGGGLFGNHEFGVHTENQAVVEQSLAYFDGLWKLGQRNLTKAQVARWRQTVDRARSKRGTSSKGRLPDEGETDSSDGTPPLGGTVTGVTKEEYLKRGYMGTRFYVKFFGQGHDRCPGERSVREAIESTECHYACTYPRNRRPRQVKHGDFIYLSFLTREPWGHAIFGRAKAIPYRGDSDDASAAEKERKPWKEHWPHYIRLFDPVFIDTTLRDCVWLQDLMNAYGQNSFLPTARNALRGHGNTNPSMSLRQQPAVALTLDAAQDLNQRFEAQLEERGAVPDSFIGSLPKPDIQQANAANRG